MLITQMTLPVTVMVMRMRMMTMIMMKQSQYANKIKRVPLKGLALNLTARILSIF